MRAGVVREGDGLSPGRGGAGLGEPAPPWEQGVQSQPRRILVGNTPLRPVGGLIKAVQCKE